MAAAGGAFPRTPDTLRALPGIGPYTADAIAAIAFGHPVIPVDGNVERVVSRLCAIIDPMPGSKPQVRAAATALGQQDAARARPSDTAQALFDLGATICTGSAPACVLCPLTAGCRARRLGIAADLPGKAARAVRPKRFGVHFWLVDAAGQVLLRRRPPAGLLGGMTALPGTAWRSTPWSAADALAFAPDGGAPLAGAGRAPRGPRLFGEPGGPAPPGGRPLLIARWAPAPPDPAPPPAAWVVCSAKIARIARAQAVTRPRCASTTVIPAPIDNIAGHDRPDTSAG